MAQARSQFGPVGFLIRWIGALVLVGLSFNPAGYSYYHWLAGSGEQMLPLKALAGVVLVIGAVIYLRATVRSLGWLGIGLTLALLGTLVWLLVDMRWLDLGATGVGGWIAVVITATVLAVGMSWSHIRRRLSGQLDTDDVDE